MTRPSSDTATDAGPGAMLADVLADVLAGVTRLVQGELALARAEAAERLDSARRALAQVAIAVVLGITAINLLAAAAVSSVAGLGLGTAWASVIVGGIVLLLALGVAGQANQLLRDASRARGRSATSIRRDVDTLQKMGKRDAPT